MSDFQKTLKENPYRFSRDTLLTIDEGDTILVKEMHEQLSKSSSKNVLLLSAVPQEAWSGAQKLSFSTIKGYKPLYLDARCLFPKEKSLAADYEPELLPLDTEDILKLASKKAETQPVLFYGSSSTY